MALLRELTMTAGTMAIGKHNSETLSTAYCAQSPWIFAGSIRDNILFGEKYDDVRFRKVIEVCALQRDLTLFPDAENTLIGEKGTQMQTCTFWMIP
jgi:ATP-binding cassette, subfamily C (CFTR/MRP), member 4